MAAGQPDISDGKHYQDRGHITPGASPTASVGGGRSRRGSKRRNGRIPPASRTKWERTNG